MGKSALVGAVWLSTVSQGTWEKYHHPSMHQVMSRQTLVSAVDPAVAHERVLAPLGHGPEALGEHSLR